ncbi:MAG: hypothetical protein ACKOBG_00080, partial [Actinomycetota bacterium]
MPGSPQAPTGVCGTETRKRGTALNLDDVVQALRRRWRLAAGIFLLVVVGVGIFVFARVRTRPPVRFRSVATVQVATPEKQTEDSGNRNGNRVSTTTAPDITLSGPQRLALAKPTIAKALGPNLGPDALRTRFNARRDKERGTIDLVVTAPTGTQARTVASRWADAFVAAHREENIRQLKQQERRLGERIKTFHDELQIVDYKLAKLMPIVYGGILRYDSPAGTGRGRGSRFDDTGRPPVPEVAPSTYALNLAYERQQLQQVIGELAENLAALRVEGVQQTTFQRVAQTPAGRVTHSRPTTMPALVALLLGLLVAGGAAVLVDRSDRTIRDAATAALAFGAPVLTRIPVNGEGDFAVLAHPSSIASDAYRGLAATAIATDRLPRAIMVSTPHGDTHEPVAANFAAALSRLGLRVALVATGPEQAWYMKPFSLPRAGGMALPELLELAQGGRL